MPVRAILDACVLIPAPLRDILFRTSQANLFSMRFSDGIIDEVHRNLIKKNMATEESADRLVSIISKNFGGSFVENYKQFIPLMPINAHDQHVLAAAVACQADYIITQNLRDFPQEVLKCFRVEALSPDQFLLGLFLPHPEIVADLLVDQANNLRNPPKTVFEVIDKLEIHAPKFCEKARNYIKSIKPANWGDVVINTQITEIKK